MGYTWIVTARILTFAILLLLLPVACSPVGISGNTPSPVPALVSLSPTSAVPPSPSPGPRIHFGHIGLEAGLSQSSVMAIVQDRQGFMWFGAEDGLNRYDGEQFNIFRPQEADATSISDVWISALALDADGALWVGTRQGGANRYNAGSGKFTRYQHQDGVIDSLSHNYIHVIFSDAQGRLWFGTEIGLDLFDPQSGGFRHFIPPNMDEISIQAITQDAQGALWIGTFDGLWRFNPNQGTFSSFETPGNPFPIIDILVNPNGTLWLASLGGGLIQYNPQTKISTKYLIEKGISYNNVRRLCLDPSGKIWVGTTFGLNLFDPATRVFIKYYNDSYITTSLSQNLISTLYLDRSGILWIATYGGGLNTYDPLDNKFTHYYHEPENPQSLSQNIVFSIAPASDGTVWIGTYGGGLDHYDPRTDTFTHFRIEANNPHTLSSNYINYVFIASDGSIWIGSEEGLDRLDPATRKFTHFPSGGTAPTSLPGTQVYVIYEDVSGTLWVGTNKGLAQYNSSKGTFTRYTETGDSTGLNGSMVTSIFEDKKGMLWVGTFSGGLSRLDLQSGTFKHYRHDPQIPGSISNDSILGILEARDNTLWVGTAGGGLNRFNPTTESFTQFDEKDGLPNNIIYGILEDENGYLWLSTNFGVARFEPQTGTSRNYTIADGLQSNEFNMGAYALGMDGSMYFGGINGFNIFQPSNMSDNSYIPPISLVSVTQNGTPLEKGIAPEALQSISLKYPHNSFEFEFAALSFSQSSRNQYAYKLEEYDKDWYYAGTNRAGRYSNLPGGEYLLRLKGSNSDGVWNEEGTAVKVIVIPPFWQTWWFYSAIGLTLVGGIFGTYRLRVYGVETQKRELERQVAERTLEMERLFEKTKDLAIVEERNRLARELHDSAKQKAFAALAQLGTANGILKKDPKAARNHLTEAENLVYEVIEELTFLIQEMYPVALKEKGLAATLREYVFEWENRTDIQADVRIEGEQRLNLDIEQAIYRVVQEALSNVSRHSHARHVEVELTYEKNNVSVIIADNGCGFDKEATLSGVGLRSIRERVESLCGVVEITSLPDCGTRLTVHLPT
jgi:signal transduction histidine kinase/ligand-binding sensor domain-containing protein